jgi:predicted PurR-regulated permease PerM
MGGDGSSEAPAGGPDPVRRAADFVEQAGRLAWGFIGLCIAAAIVFTLLAAASSVVLPLFLAVVLAIVFRPVVRWLERHRLPPPVASGVVVVGLVLACVAFVWMVVSAIVHSSDEIWDQLEAALTEVGFDASATEDISSSAESLEPTVTSGFVETVIAGIDALAGFIAGSVLGILILYYMLKEGGTFLRTVERRMLPGRATQLGLLVDDGSSVMRNYWFGRSIVSAVVAGVVGIAALLMGLPLVPTLVAVTFVGGFIPYIGAFIGGLLAVIVAIAELGLGAGVAMLLVVLVANLLVENMVDPHVTGRTLRIHPLVVLLLTTAGGVVGGLLGLMMAVPITLIAVRAVTYIRAAFESEEDGLKGSIRSAAAAALDGADG